MNSASNVRFIWDTGTHNLHKIRWLLGPQRRYRIGAWEEPKLGCEDDVGGVYEVEVRWSFGTSIVVDSRGHSVPRVLEAQHLVWSWEV